ncbi:hypothetical protein HRR83_006746 [Exophiala dermatitidis]|uniref:Uncharacterized protein n=1 Tax=Exophiala dermatitidis TaxID=5970 RepID=A0AAN6IUI8_EXODE|nr:hypothetical protein HRR74_005907 [Exophiala dermatitidis]KAJ4515269.1 hypothetical protein HRR73_005100 [Exophiala dermatitidis]KAJ4535327.1 hypothetical protein HRR77_007945 [Exophiala dermatitidis]KAJ4540793.1 hypothetical protein HRR76_004178 [Exophiala dermatitidis]KAJ4556946.1 hypothetical protein HRR79_008751 [Exophiala dermatitidis]
MSRHMDMSSPLQDQYPISTITLQHQTSRAAIHLRGILFQIMTIRQTSRKVILDLLGYEPIQQTSQFFRNFFGDLRSRRNERKDAQVTRTHVMIPSNDHDKRSEATAMDGAYTCYSGVWPDSLFLILFSFSSKIYRHDFGGILWMFKLGACVS